MKKDTLKSDLCGYVGGSPFPQGLLATSLWGQGAEAMTENSVQPVSKMKTALQETASANLLNFTPECMEYAGLGWLENHRICIKWRTPILSSQYDL